MSVKKVDNELIRHNYLQEITYHYSAGKIPSRFFHELRETGKLHGIKCPECSKVYIPPRLLCPECSVKMNEWVEIGPKGTLVAGTVCNHSFPDPLTGKVRKAPYGLGLIRLDGCSTNFFFFLEESDIKKVQPGMRMEAVFAEERKGDLNDLIHFREIEE